jgi:hypothetical protein
MRKFSCDLWRKGGGDYWVVLNKSSERQKKQKMNEERNVGARESSWPLGYKPGGHKNKQRRDIDIIKFNSNLKFYSVWILVIFVTSFIYLKKMFQKNYSNYLSFYNIILIFY